MFSLDEAVNKVLNEFFANDKENVIFKDEEAEATSFGWALIFTYKFDAAGLGPIIFNKLNGEYHHISPGDNLDEAIIDYEKELEAGDKQWTLSLSDLHDRKKAISASRKIFSLNLKESLSFIPKDLTPIFSGKWRMLEGLKKLYQKEGVNLALKITDNVSTSHTKEFIPDRDMIWKLRMLNEP